MTFTSPHLTDVYVIDSSGDFSMYHFDRVGYCGGWRIMSGLFDAGSVDAVGDAVLDRVAARVEHVGDLGRRLL